MNRDLVYAKAVAYTASREARHYLDLSPADLEDFWRHVARIDNGRQPNERERLWRHFWRDQGKNGDEGVTA